MTLKLKNGNDQYQITKLSIKGWNKSKIKQHLFSKTWTKS